MSVKINTYSKVIKTITYLEKELMRSRLSKDTAILYFQILIDREEDNIIERPFFTYNLDDFDTYLDFFTRYNLLDSVNRSIKENTYSVSENWRNRREIYTIPSTEEESFLSFLKEYDEFNLYYFISA